MLLIETDVTVLLSQLKTLIILGLEIADENMSAMFGVHLIKGVVHQTFHRTKLLQPAMLAYFSEHLVAMLGHLMEALLVANRKADERSDKERCVLLSHKLCRKERN